MIPRLPTSALRSCALCSCLLAAVSAAAAAPSDAHPSDPASEPRRLLQAAADAEKDGRWSEALTRYEALVLDHPVGPAAESARRRAERLQQRRDPDGGFGSWAALEDVRRNFRTLEPARAVRRVLAVYDNPEAPWAVRVEAGLWAARQLDDPERVERLTAALWPGLQDTPQDLRKQLTLARAESLAGVGRYDEAAEVESRILPEANLGRRTRVGELRREARRRLMARLSGIGIGLFALLAIPLAAPVFLRQPRPRPLGLVPLCLILVTAALLAEGWEHGLGKPVLLALGPLCLVHLLSLGAARQAAGRPPLRIITALLSVWATLGVLYLALHAEQRLAWVGL